MLLKTYIVLVMAGMSGLIPMVTEDSCTVKCDETYVQLDMVNQENSKCTPLISIESVRCLYSVMEHPIQSDSPGEITSEGYIPRKEKKWISYTHGLQCRYGSDDINTYELKTHYIHGAFFVSL